MKEQDVVYRAMSFTDLESLGFILTVKITNDKPYIESIKKDGAFVNLRELLWTCGIKDNAFFHITEKCEHVRINGSKTINYRLNGQERTDKEWLKSGHASDEAKMFSSGMSDAL